MNYITKISDTCDIVVPPCELMDIAQYTYNVLKQRIHTCSELHGYIIDITDVQNISNIISRVTSNCICKVSYTIHCLKPQPNHIYVATIILIRPECIFCEYNSMHIAIAMSDELGWMYNKTYYEKDDKKLKKGDYIRVKIQYTKYENMKYKCIGTIVD